MLDGRRRGQGWLCVFLLKALVWMDDWTPGLGLLTASLLLVLCRWVAGDLGKVGLVVSFSKLW